MAECTPAPANAVLKYRRDDVSKETLEALCHNQPPYSNELNLHSKSKQGAVSALSAWLDSMLDKKAQSVLVIHGKGLHSGGASIVKALTAKTLEDHPNVGAYCSALPKDGSTGAVYVLLLQ